MRISGFPLFFSAIAVLVYPPTIVLKMLRLLGKEPDILTDLVRKGLTRLALSGLSPLSRRVLSAIWLATRKPATIVGLPWRCKEACPTAQMMANLEARTQQLLTAQTPLKHQDKKHISLHRPFPVLGGTLHGPFPECFNGPFSLLKSPWKTAHFQA